MSAERRSPAAGAGDTAITSAGPARSGRAPVGRRSVWHAGVAPTADTVNGITQTVWSLARAQARAGHDVTLLAHGSPEQVDQARRAGLDLVPPSNATARQPPDVLHLHSVFIPAQARLARWAVRRGVPYVVTPHGGVAPQVLRRGRLKKRLYSTAVERPRFRGASAITAVTPGELAEIARFVGRRAAPMSVVPNAVEPPPHDLPVVEAEDVVFLGRLDTHLKGLDRLAAYAAALPDVTFGVYGVGVRDTLPPFPPNVRVREPVYGSRKWGLLRGAALCLQPSRWEAFGLSVCEAALVGTPSAIARGMHLAEVVEPWGVVVLDVALPVERQAAQLRELLERRADRRPDERLRRLAAGALAPDRVAVQLDTVYGSATAAGARSDRYTSRSWRRTMSAR